MRLICQTADLNASLSTVSHALPIRSPKPVLEGILLESCEAGLRITCTDLTLGIETIIPSTFAEEGRAVLPGKLLCEVIRKLPGEQVEISVNDRMQATIRSGGSRTSLRGFDPIEYPELPAVAGSSFTMQQNTLHDMIQKTAFAIAVDESRPILTGCLMEIHKEEIHLVALDGFRLAMRSETITGPEKDINAVIGGKVLSDIAKILSDTEERISMCFSRTHVEMHIGNTRIIARLLEGEFIRYQQILPSSWKTQITVNCNALSSAIERASLIAREGKTNLACFKIDDSSLSVTSNSETGDVEEHLDIETVGAGLSIAFNVRYIMDVLKAIDSENIVMRFNSNISPCIVCPPDSDSSLYLVLPVRVFTA